MIFPFENAVGVTLLAAFAILIRCRNQLRTGCCNSLIFAVQKEPVVYRG
jgi:hypothetical protein